MQELSPTSLLIYFFFTLPTLKNICGFLVKETVLQERFWQDESENHTSTGTDVVAQK